MKHNIPSSLAAVGVIPSKLESVSNSNDHITSSITSLSSVGSDIGNSSFLTAKAASSVVGISSSYQFNDSSSSGPTLNDICKGYPISTIKEIIDNDSARKNYDLNRIVCAANRCIGSPTILGARHWDETMHSTYNMLKELNQHVYSTLNMDFTFPETHMYEQGFIDKRGEFKTRQQAWHIAKAAGQIIRLCGGNDKDGGTLYSENLY